MGNNYPYGHCPRPEMLKFIPKQAMRILEVGCGDGAFCQTMKNQNFEREIWGLELNGDVAEKAKNLCDKVLVGDFNDLYHDLPENYFDCIVFNDVLEHLLEPWNVIKDCKSLLSETGILVSSLPNF